MWHIQYDYFNTQVEETLFTEFVNVVINILSSCTQFMVILIATLYRLYLMCFTVQDLRNQVFSLQNINVVDVPRPENLHSTQTILKCLSQVRKVRGYIYVYRFCLCFYIIWLYFKIVPIQSSRIGIQQQDRHTAVGQAYMQGTLTCIISNRFFRQTNEILMKYCFVLFVYLFVCFCLFAC